MKLTKRLLTWVLVLTMVFSLLPMPARAEETSEETVPETIPEAQTETIPETVPEEVQTSEPVTKRVTTVIPFQVNPLYADVVSAEDFDIPDFTGIDPEQLEPQAVTYRTVSNAGQKIREQMVARKESFTIYVKSDVYDEKELAAQMMDIALKHTGNTLEGDYLMWQFGGWTAQVTRSYNSYTEMYEFSYEFFFSYYTTYDQEQQMNTAVNKLINTLGVKRKSDYEKVCAVYNWICANVTYDYDNLEDTSYTLKHTAYAALINKTAVCQGYAVLFYRMMMELDVDCRVIPGLAASGEAHGWNIVKLGDYYYNLDSTWDAGMTEYSFFLKNTWEFGGHERFMEYDTIAFHDEYPMAAESYEDGKTATKDPYIAAGYCGADIYNATWWLGRDGSLTIKGTGNTYDFSSSSRPYFRYWEDNITKVIVEDGVTGLGDYTLYWFEALKEVEIAGSVKYIGEHCFHECNNLEQVTLHEGLEEIGAYAFNRCWSIPSIDFPSTLKRIGANAFNYSYRMVITELPAGLESLGDYAFRSCYGIQSLTIHAGLTEGGDYAFDNCSNLVTLTLAEGVETVPRGMFAQCSDLTTVNFPSTLKTIGEYAFSECKALETITLPESLETIEPWAFTVCALTEVQIPERVTRIGKGAFNECSELTKVSLPTNLTIIEESVFANCALESIEFPGSIKRIEMNAFYNCTNLTEVNLPEGLEYVSGFSRCNGMTSVVLPESVTEIGQFAFGENTGLTSVNIPEAVTKIGSSAFYGCTNLESLDLPAALTEISSYMARNCTSLTEIIIPSNVTSIGDYAFEACSGLQDITFPQNLQTIGEFAFGSCTALTEITLPTSVTCIDRYAFSSCSGLETATLSGLVDSHAFRYCTSLKHVELEENVPTLYYNAFEGCTALESIIIADSVTRIWHNCFEGCKALQEITFLGDAPDFISDAFNTVRATAYYPAGNDTWTEDVMKDYGGMITWVSYAPPCTEHTYEAVITAPTCQEGGYTTYTCTICGETNVGDYTDPVDHSYENGSCIWCDKETYTIKWISGTTSLNGTIDLNIYVALSENLLDEEDAFIRFTHSGVTVDVPVSKGLKSEKNGTVCYRYSCEIFAKQVADTVTVQVMDENGQISKTLNYSVMQYCANQIKNSQDEKLVAVCKTLLNYAAAAQTYFGYNTENLANASLSEEDKALFDVDASAYAYDISGKEPGIRASSATLMLESEVKIRVYFQLTGDKTIEDYTFTIDGKEVEVQQNDKGYYIESDGIPAKALDDMHQFCVGGITVEYGALSYVNSKVTSSKTEENERNLAKALYAYYAAAEALLG